MVLILTESENLNNFSDSVATRVVDGRNDRVQKNDSTFSVDMKLTVIEWMFKLFICFLNYILL